MIITHDHWDHLDYQTVTSLKNRVSRVICPLGIGEHLEYWGYTPEQIIEMDWDEQFTENDFTIYCLPTRHFSGRNFKSNQTLWSSYIIKIQSKTIYLSGDGGYGKHFREIAKKFPEIDLAIIENGQYNENWRYIHLMPEDLAKVIDDLKPKRVFAGHNGKYALSKHPWDEPLENSSHIQSVITPMIGQVVNLQDTLLLKDKWWK